MPIVRITDFASGALRNKYAYAWFIRSLQLCLIVLCGAAAFVLRFDFAVPDAMRAPMLWALACWILTKVPVFHLFGLGRGVWRYFTILDLKRVAKANVLGSAVAAAVILAAGPVPFPRSVLIIDFVLTLLATAGVRATTRILQEAGARMRSTGRRNAYIYGAGAAGSMLLLEARTNAAFGRAIRGFIDDDGNKQGMLLQGVPVRGGGKDLAALAAANGVEEVLIAIPSATGAQMSRIVEHCRRAGLAFRTMPALSEIVAGRGAASQVRDVAVEDLLGRGSVQLDNGKIQAKLSGRVALVTGAAGSIGSELCRQIARFRPACLVAVEVSETALFHLEREMRQNFPDVPFRAEIGNIQNPQRLCEIFTATRPAVVFHAAAYKHVPMMESHAFEAVENNIFGTFNVAVAAAEAGVEDFVMISSDKAVRPTNIMGASKRVAELLIRSLQNGGPRFVSVRFGNVLGSNGSVVPIFKQQIAAGGPVTVTHPEMRRYFMTIPEAAQLVLQASTMGKGGEIFVLDMGEPVKIVDLAYQLIVLSGLTPHDDIRIEFTGVRPGEKLYEELNMDEEHTVPTYHEKVRIFAGNALPEDTTMRHLTTLRAACARRDLDTLVYELRQMVPDYTPSQNLLDRSASRDLMRLAHAVAPDAGPSPQSTAVPAAACEGVLQ
jgi:FlaA1/EpsC-like NDP-sugar epimerase